MGQKHCLWYQRMIRNPVFPLTSKMIKQAAKAYGKEIYKKAPMAWEKEACTQTVVTGTETQIYVKSESQVETEERFDAIITSDKYLVPNLIVVIVIQMMINNFKCQPTYTQCSMDSRCIMGEKLIS